MVAETIELENTASLRGSQHEGVLALLGDALYLDHIATIEGAIDGEPRTTTATMSLAEQLRLAYGAEEALGRAMELDGPVDATETRVSLGRVRITVEFLPAD